MVTFLMPKSNFKLDIFYNLLRKLLNANKELQLYVIGKYMCQDSFRSWEPIFLAASWSPHLFCSHNRLPLIKL